MRPSVSPPKWLNTLSRRRLCEMRTAREKCNISARQFTLSLTSSEFLYHCHWSFFGNVTFPGASVGISRTPSSEHTRETFNFLSSAAIATSLFTLTVVEKHFPDSIYTKLGLPAKLLHLCEEVRPSSLSLHLNSSTIDICLPLECSVSRSIKGEFPERPNFHFYEIRFHFARPFQLRNG